MDSFKLLSKQWLVDENNEIIIGEGRKEILETIERTGSLNQTAKIMKMSYKGVWSKVKATEAHMNTKIVHADRKLGSRLTKEGKELLERYNRLKKECVKADDRIFKSVFKEEYPPLVIIAGMSGSGKTTLLEKLIPEIKKKGLRVGTIKHHPGDYDIDHPGKDSWRHKKAGAESTIISSPGQISMVMDADHDHRPYELISFFSEMDIILVEGFKFEHLPKVEIFRHDLHHKPQFIEDPNLIAIMTDADLDLDIATFGLDDIKGLGDYLVRYFELAKA
jgi:molybdopterin-guanine dinucleotide biosynthesis protein B